MLLFEWDDDKAESNYVKHKVTFDEAMSVFDDVNGLLIEDDSETEERFVLLGFSNSVRILVVVHCFRNDEKNIRIISARKANKREQRKYKEQL